MPLPPFTEDDELPPGVHRTTLRETMERFGAAPVQRRAIALRLERIHQLAQATGHLARFVVFGSFVTAKPEPNDLDVFLLMAVAFDSSELTGDARLLFDHAVAQSHFGASVFSMRRLAALGGEQETIEYWPIKRDGGQRGILEIIPESL